MTSEEEEFPANGRQGLSYPRADIILRSRGSAQFRVPKVYIVDSSPVLAGLIRTSSYPPRPNTSASPIANSASPLPVVQLSDRGRILASLFSFILPTMTVKLPPTLEDLMELLSTAQKYEMDLVLIRIRDHIARQHPPLIRDENAFYVYSLAQKHGLRHEADQAARFTLKISMDIEDLETTCKLDIPSGALLHRLWEYHRRVRKCLMDDCRAFTMLGAGARINFRCVKLSSSNVPIWLSDYINSVAANPALFNLSEFHMALTRHVIPSPVLYSSRPCPSCASISPNTIDTFWTALSDVVQHSIQNVEANFLLENDIPSRQSRSRDPSANISPPQGLTMQDADVVLLSSDGAPFRVHRSILSTSSPFFHDMFTLPQPPDNELVDGLPAVRLSEDAELLQCLVSVLYPIPSVIPDHDKALDLLAVSHKYDMASVQSSIRAEMKSKDLRPLTAAATFRAYGFASTKGLIQEMESAARLSLEYPMTLESMGDGLATFGRWEVRDLARYRKRCRDSLVSCLESLLNSRLSPSNIWVGCPNTSSATIALWLHTLFSGHIIKLRNTFTHSLLKPSSLRAEYLAALQAHVTQIGCAFCSKVHILHGETFCVQLNKKLTKALDGVRFNPDPEQGQPSRTRLNKGSRMN